LLLVYQQGIQTKKIALTPKVGNTVFALYAIIHHLALRQEILVNAPGEQGRVANHILHFPGKIWDTDSCVFFPDPDDFSRRCDLINYFKESFESLNGTSKVLTPPTLFDFANSNLNELKSSGGYEKGLAGLLKAFAQDARFRKKDEDYV